MEVDDKLDQGRCQRADGVIAFLNYPNDYSQMTVKTQLGGIDIKVLE